MQVRLPVAAPSPTTPHPYPIKPTACLSARVPALPACLPALPARMPALPDRVPALPAQVPARVPDMPARMPALPAQVPALPARMPALPARMPALPARMPDMPACLPRFACDNPPSNAERNRHKPQVNGFLHACRLSRWAVTYGKPQLNSVAGDTKYMVDPLQRYPLKKGARVSFSRLRCLFRPAKRKGGILF